MEHITDTIMLGARQAVFESEWPGLEVCGIEEPYDYAGYRVHLKLSKQDAVHTLIVEIDRVDVCELGVEGIVWLVRDRVKQACGVLEDREVGGVMTKHVRDVIQTAAHRVLKEFSGKHIELFELEAPIHTSGWRLRLAIDGRDSLFLYSINYSNAEIESMSTDVLAYSVASRVREACKELKAKVEAEDD